MVRLSPPPPEKNIYEETKQMLQKPCKTTKVKTQNEIATNQTNKNPGVEREKKHKDRKIYINLLA